MMLLISAIMACLLVLIPGGFAYLGIICAITIIVDALGMSLSLEQETSLVLFMISLPLSGFIAGKLLDQYISEKSKLFQVPLMVCTMYYCLSSSLIEKTVTVVLLQENKVDLILMLSTILVNVLLFAVTTAIVIMISIALFEFISAIFFQNLVKIISLSSLRPLIVFLLLVILSNRVSSTYLDSVIESSFQADGISVSEQ